MKRSSNDFECTEDEIVLNAEPDRKRARLSINKNTIDKDTTGNRNDIVNGGIDKESCKRQLATILSTISYYGEISVSGSGTRYLPDICGLHINGIGSVPLPLCSLLANALFNLSHCKIANFGCESESKQDENVSHVYEIDSTQFRFENVEFNNGIHSNFYHNQTIMGMMIVIAMI